MKVISLFLLVIILFNSCRSTSDRGCNYARSHQKQLKKYHRHHRHHSK